MKIGVMGARGSFSEEAGEEYMKTAGIQGGEIVPLVTCERVLTAIEEGEADIGIFPIENSNGGVVIEAVHAMAKHRFAIEKMFEIDIRHCLLVRHGVTAAHIMKITSHDQAIKQCRMYLKRVWPHVELAEYEDTAAAAKALHDGELPDTTAVIAPKQCTKLYDLEVLEESIQDLKFNYTTFIAVTKLS